jgi:hypothetical protein
MRRHLARVSAWPGPAPSARLWQPAARALTGTAEAGNSMVTSSRGSALVARMAHHVAERPRTSPTGERNWASPPAAPMPETPGAAPETGRATCSCHGRRIRLAPRQLPEAAGMRQDISDWNCWKSVRQSKTWFAGVIVGISGGCRMFPCGHWFRATSAALQRGRRGYRRGGRHR